jgi:hypothetical protein
LDRSRSENSSHDCYHRRLQLRVARHTDDLAAVVDFDRDRVGLPEIGLFEQQL